MTPLASPAKGEGWWWWWWGGVTASKTFSNVSPAVPTTTSDHGSSPRPLWRSTGACGALSPDIGARLERRAAPRRSKQRPRHFPASEASSSRRSWNEAEPNRTREENRPSARGSADGAVCGHCWSASVAYYDYYNRHYYKHY